MFEVFLLSGWCGLLAVGCKRIKCLKKSEMGSVWRALSQRGLRIELRKANSPVCFHLSLKSSGVYADSPPRFQSSSSQMLSIKLGINWLSSHTDSSWRNLWELVGVLKRPMPVGKPPRALPVCACLLLWNKHLFLVVDYKELIGAKAAMASSYLCKIQQLN